jgi:hypothetical protein
MKTRMSFRIILLAAAVVAAVPIGWAVQVQAQGAPQGAPPMAAGAQQVQGKITALDSSKGMLTLEDGTQLTIPPGAQLPPDVKEGSIIKASFEERSGQKVLTGLELQKP